KEVFARQILSYGPHFLIQITLYLIPKFYTIPRTSFLIQITSYLIPKVYTMPRTSLYQKMSILEEKLIIVIIYFLVKIGEFGYFVIIHPKYMFVVSPLANFESIWISKSQISFISTVSET
ncbi:hypothetical protein DD606_25620, partial [Enterobacter cloacae complex sp. GF14B]